MVGCSVLLSRRRSVDLPAPFIPTRAIFSPLCIVRFTFLNTLFVSYVFSRFSAVITFSPLRGASENLKWMCFASLSVSIMSIFSSCFILLWTWVALVALYLNFSTNFCMFSIFSFCCSRSASIRALRSSFSVRYFS